MSLLHHHATGWTQRQEKYTINSLRGLMKGSIQISLPPPPDLTHTPFSHSPSTGARTDQPPAEVDHCPLKSPKQACSKTHVISCLWQQEQTTVTTGIETLHVFSGKKRTVWGEKKPI